MVVLGIAVFFQALVSVYMRELILRHYTVQGVRVHRFWVDNETNAALSVFLNLVLVGLQGDHHLHRSLRLLRLEV